MRHRGLLLLASPSSPGSRGRSSLRSRLDQAASSGGSPGTSSGTGTGTGPSGLRVVVCTLLPGGGYMRTAMERLGMAPYCLFDAVRDSKRSANRLAFTAAVRSGQAIPLHIIGGKNCLVGPPGASPFAVKELVSEHPDLKFVLVVEDDKDETAARLHAGIDTYCSSIPKVMVPRARDLMDVVYHSKDQRVSANGLVQYENAISEFVPRDRLLIFSYGDGWEPLCEFLGLDEPPETVEFPAYCDGVKDLERDTVKMKRAAQYVQVVKMVIACGVLLVITVLCSSESMEFVGDTLDSYRDLQRMRAEAPLLTEAGSSLAEQQEEQMLRATQERQCDLPTRGVVSVRRYTVVPNSSS